MATATDTTSPTNALDGTPTANPSVDSADPFASQREEGGDPFAAKSSEEAVADDGAEGLSPPPEGGKARRMSKEWDASKVPPSQFQKRKGSIYATPSSRDSHTTSERDKAYFEKIKEKGWDILKKK